MANQSSDRQRMSHDLRALAKLAKPGSDSPVHGFDTADSSGYVDLSAYSTSDAGWVDRELARARKGAPPPLPPPPRGARVIDVLTPQSMAPVSLEALGEPEDTMNVRVPRPRRAMYAVLGIAAVGAVGFLAFTLAKHPPPPAQAQNTSAAAVVAPPPVADPTPPPAVTSAATTTVAAIATTAAAPASTTPVVATSTTTTKASKKVFSAPKAHAVAQAQAPTPAAVHTAAALPAVVIPKAKPSSGGDSLMDLIKKSVATGK